MGLPALYVASNVSRRGQSDHETIQGRLRLRLALVFIHRAQLVIEHPFRIRRWQIIELTQ